MFKMQKNKRQNINKEQSSKMESKYRRIYGSSKYKQRNELNEEQYW